MAGKGKSSETTKEKARVKVATQKTATFSLVRISQMSLPKRLKLKRQLNHTSGVMSIAGNRRSRRRSPGHRSGERPGQRGTHETQKAEDWPSAAPGEETSLARLRTEGWRCRAELGQGCASTHAGVLLINQERSLITAPKAQGHQGQTPLLVPQH